MMAKVFARIAAIVALVSLGTSAQASFNVIATITGNPSPIAGLVFSSNDLTVASTPNPSIPVSYNVLNIVYSGAIDANTTFSLTESFTVNNIGVGSGTFTATFGFRYQVDTSGYGNLSLMNVSGFPTTVAGVTFTAPVLAAPTITPLQVGQTTGGNISTTALASNPPPVVPEPASIAMVGLGLAGVGVVARLRAKG